MENKRLIPYSVYIPADLHIRLKKSAKHRQASSMVRDALQMFLDGNDAFRSGYNKGIKEAAKVVFECPEAQMVAVKGKDIGAYLCEQIQMLEMK